MKFCEKGLHDIGAQGMSGRLQAEIEAVKNGPYEAILLGYGLCSYGTTGLRSRLPLVLPRAHDCITLLMGSKEKYLAYFNQNPGTYYKSTGWVEHGTSSLDNPSSTVSLLGMKTYEEYVKKYGEETAQYLMETLTNMQHYDRFTYIDTGVGDFPEYRREVQRLATEKNWKYEVVQGNINLFMRLVNGAWDEADFLVIPPGHTGRPSYDEAIVACAAAPPPTTGS